MRFVSNRDIAIGVTSIVEATGFYEDVLGFKPEKTEPKLRVYNTGHFTLYVMEGEPHPPIPSYTVDSLNDAKKHLNDNECIVLIEMENSLYFRDSMGSAWDIIEKD